jgi:uncharacterized protein YcbX
MTNPVLTEINLYPIKSCGVISLHEASLSAAGLCSQLVYDREWMVVGDDGVALTQRVHPKMALITPRIKADTQELRAPGMLRLEIPLELPDPDLAPTLEVRVWDSTVRAYDCDATTAAWFSQALGISCRLVRFHPHAKRFSDLKWTGGVESPALFADGYALLAVSQASLDDLNEKLVAQGRDAIPMNRFRPNLVFNNVAAFEEDFALTIQMGDAILRPVKPCSRCPLPAVVQETGEVGPDPMDILQTYRANPKLEGGISFGMHCIVQTGEGTVLRIGQPVKLELAF